MAGNPSTSTVKRIVFAVRNSLRNSSNVDNYKTTTMQHSNSQYAVIKLNDCYRREPLKWILAMYAF